MNFKNFYYNEESLIGGNADGKSLEDIAKKHGVDIDTLKKEFDDITGDDDAIETATLEYLENFNEYFLKYPKK